MVLANLSAIFFCQKNYECERKPRWFSWNPVAQMEWYNSLKRSFLLPKQPRHEIAFATTVLSETQRLLQLHDLDHTGQTCTFFEYV